MVQEVTPPIAYQKLKEAKDAILIDCRTEQEWINIGVPDLSTINDFYAMLDLYIVAARYEGGPQAIFECALTETPIISTRVGASEYILSESSIYEPGSELTASPDVEYAAKQVKKYNIPLGMDPFITFFRGI